MQYFIIILNVPRTDHLLFHLKKKIDSTKYLIVLYEILDWIFFRFFCHFFLGSRNFI